MLATKAAPIDNRGVKLDKCDNMSGLSFLSTLGFEFKVNRFSNAISPAGKIGKVWKEKSQSFSGSF